MRQQQHIIGRTRLEINSDRLSQTWRFQQEMSDIFQEQAIPSLEQLFDQLVDVDERVCLNQVVIELVPLNPDNLAEDFVNNLLAALQEILGDRIEKAGVERQVYTEQSRSEAGGGLERDLTSPMIPDNSLRLSGGLKPSWVSPTSSEQQLTRSLKPSDRQQRDWEIFLYFLQYGRLPWWCLENDWKTFLTNWDRIRHQKTPDVTALRTLLKSSVLARKRLVRQFSAAFCQQIVLLLQPTWESGLKRLREAQHLMKALSISDRLTQTLETQTWYWILAQLGTTSSDRPFPISDWLEVWFTYLLEGMKEEGLMSDLDQLFNTDTSEKGQTENSVLYSHLQTLIESLEITDTTLWLKALERVVLSSFPASSSASLSHHPTTPKQASDIENNQSRQNRFQEDRDSLSNDLNEDKSPSLPSDAISQKLDFRNAQKGQTFRKHGLEEGKPDSNQGNIPDPQQHSQTVPESPLITDQNSLFKTQETVLSSEEIDLGLFINHTGLVILHPFLSVYFEKVGLLKEGGFQDPTSQEIAIYLLYYLATGETDAPEYELVLPKLLCGCSLNEPVTPPQTFPETALTEAEHLLETVITHWSVLKNASPDGLREGFLQRGGKLTLLNQGDWRLQVEQTAIDVLLSRLPWGLSVIKLPWMETLLMVEWI